MMNPVEVPSEPKQPQALTPNEILDYASYEYDALNTQAMDADHGTRQNNEKKAEELGQTRLILAEAIENVGNDSTKVRDYLSEKTSEFEKGLRTPSGNEDADIALHEQYESYLRAQMFLYENKMRRLDEHEGFQEWKRRQASDDKKLSRDDGKNVAHENQKERIFELRESLSSHEKERLIENVVGKSAKRIDVPAPENASSSKKSGLKTDTRRYLSNALLRQEDEVNILSELGMLVRHASPEWADIRPDLARHHVNEFLYIEDTLQRPVYKEPNGMMGIMKSWFKREISHYEPRRFMEFYHDESFRHDDLDIGSPVIRFTYLVHGEPREELAGEPDSFVSLQLIMPQETGMKLIQAIEDDPSVIREIYKRSLHERKFLPRVIGQEDADFSSGAYDPPFEEWDKREGGGRIYVQKGASDHKWHPEFVRSVK